MRKNNELPFEAIVVALMAKDKTLYKKAVDIDKELGNDRLRHAFFDLSGDERVKEIDIQIQEYAKTVLKMELVNRKPTAEEVREVERITKKLVDEYPVKIGFRTQNSEHIMEMKIKDIKLLKSTFRLLVIAMLSLYILDGTGLLADPFWFNVMTLLKYFVIIKWFRIVIRLWQLVGGN